MSSFYFIHSRLDSILGDSVLKHDVTVVSGYPGLGKTQFTMSIVCQCLLQKKPCLYINSGCNFVIDRIVEILTSLGADVDSSLSLLYIENSYDAYELYDILEKFQPVSTIIILNCRSSKANVGVVW